MNYELTLIEQCKKHPNTLVLTAENRALIRTIPQELPFHFYDFGITEQTMMGAAAGLALRGNIPIVHALATFLTLRPFEFIRDNIGIPGLPVKLTGFIPGVLSEANGPTHQALEDISLMRGIPNMEVYAPADEADMVGMLSYIWNSKQPAYLRANTISPKALHTPFEYGKAEVFHLGTDINILSYGALFNNALETVDRLRAAGIDTGLVNMRSLKPIDEQVVLKACAKARLTVVLEDHFQTGGLYSIVAETLLKHKKTAHVLPISFKERWFKAALLADVFSYEGLSPEILTEKIKNHLSNSLSDRSVLENLDLLHSTFN